MAALFLFVLAVAGGVVVGDLVWENPKGAEVTVFDQPVTGYSQGWLLAGAAALGFVVALLLVALVGATKGRRSVAGTSAGCGVIDASIQPSRRGSTPACWTSSSAAMTVALDLTMGCAGPGHPPRQEGGPCGADRKAY
jgi:hypothetical protein